MKREYRELPIRWQLILANILPVILTLVITTGLMLNFTIKVANERLESELRSIAYMISKTEIVVESLKRNEPNQELNEYLDFVTDSNTDIDIVTIADMTGKRIYHIDKNRIGKQFVGGDEGPVYEGNHYLSVAEGTQGEQLRYFYPIYDETGEQVGFVMASTLMKAIVAIEREIIIQMVKFSAMMLFIGFLISTFLSKRIKSTLVGYEPSQIGRLFTEREEVFNALEEGILAINQKGEIIFANQATLNLLDIQKDHSVYGKKIDTILPEIKLLHTLETIEISNNLTTVIRNHDILYDKVPIRVRNTVVGALAVIRNRTEFKRLAEQLTGVNHFADALRANNHEFMNKLHIILGLLEIGAIDEAISYIANQSHHEKMIVHTITERIKNRLVAALLLGKMSRGNELDIKVKLLPNSYLPRHSEYLSTDSLVTILGNLIENAMESINCEATEDYEEEEITLFIYEDEKALILSVDDSGAGMTDEIKERILMSRYSTKGENRGTGLTLIRQILEDCGGEMTIESNVNVGTSIIITIAKKRNKGRELVLLES